MRRFAIILAVLGCLMLAPAAFADSTHTCQGNSCNSTGTGVGDVTATGGNATAVSGASSTSGAVSGSVSGVSAKQSYEGSYSGYSGAEVRVDGGPRQAPALGIQGSVSNSTCMAHVGGGLTSPFGGGSLIVPKLDEGCDTRAFAIMLYQMGFREQAIHLVIQQSDKVREAFGLSKSDVKKTTRGEDPTMPAAPVSAQVQGN